MTKAEKINELFDLAGGLYDSDEALEASNKIGEIFEIMNDSNDELKKIFKIIILNEFDAQNAIDLEYLKELFEDKESMQENIKYFCEAFSEDEDLKFVSEIELENISEKIEKLASLIENFITVKASELVEENLKKIEKEQYLIIKDLEFDIENTEISLKKDAESQYTLFLEVKTLRKKCYGGWWQPYLYINNGIPIKIDTLDDLVGKTFEYDFEKDSSQTWIMYVFEHNDISKSKIEILSKEESTLTIKWSGTANIYFNAAYDEDVPFECVFKVGM